MRGGAGAEAAVRLAVNGALGIGTVGRAALLRLAIDRDIPATAEDFNFGECERAATGQLHADEAAPGCDHLLAASGRVGGSHGEQGRGLLISLAAEVGVTERGNAAQQIHQRGR